MLKSAMDSAATEFIVATEEGLIERMRREIPGKAFYSAGRAHFCFNMKRIRLEDVYRSLNEEIYEVTVDPDVMEKARIALERMISAKL